jgi:branched-subunit amino acid transport protein
MNLLWPILGMAGGVYAVRLAGFLLAGVAMPPDLERALRFVPVAMLTALFVSTFTARTDHEAVRIVAAIGAGLIIYRTRKIWACILGGMALYWVLGWLAGQI